MGGHQITCNFESDADSDPGPWRLPVHHRALYDYALRLGVPMQPFINRNDKALLHSRRAFQGQPQGIGHVEKDIRGHVSELLAKSLNQHSLDEAVRSEDRARLL